MTWTRVRFVLPDGLRSFLDSLLPAAGTPDLTAGNRDSHELQN